MLGAYIKVRSGLVKGIFICDFLFIDRFEREGAMKYFRKELWFNASTRRAFINITDQVENCLGESGVQEGLCLVNAMHITASVV